MPMLTYRSVSVSSRPWPVTQQKSGTSLKIALHRQLKAIVDATPSEHLTFLVSEWNKPYKNANSFGHRMRLWAREAGLTGCPLHGLRKASCRRLAEIGCSAKQIMAISGHKSLREVEKYINDADQERLAEQAMAKLVGGTDENIGSPTPPHPFTHTRKTVNESGT